MRRPIETFVKDRAARGSVNAINLSPLQSNVETELTVHMSGWRQDNIGQIRERNNDAYCYFR